MNHLLSDASVLVQSLGWTLLHSLWQGALIAAGLWLVLKMIPHARSVIKYHLSLSALSLLFVWVAGTWMHQWQLMQAVQVRVTESLADAGPARTYVITTLPQSTGSWHWLQPVWPWLERSFPVLVGLYAAGLLLMTLRLAAGFTHLYRIRRSGLQHPDTPWLQLLGTLQERLEIGRRVQLYLTSRVQLPMVMGILKPVILLPAATLAQLSPQQLEAILLHELAHIRRSDYLINLLQTIVETVLFFNPFVWQISAVIRREREHCCDDLVLDHTPEPLPYATALASIEAARLSAPVGALAAAGQPRHLLNRIKRIMEMKHQSSNYSRVIAALLVVTAITCSVIWLTPSFGQSRNKPREEAAPRRERPVTGNDQPMLPEGNDAPPDSVRAVVDRAMRLADSSLRVAGQTLNRMDPEEIRRSVDEAMGHIDWNQIERSQDKAMKEAAKALKQARRDMRREHWDELTPDQQRQVEAAMEAAGRTLRNVDLPRIRQQVAAAMKEVDWTRINADIQRGLEEAQRELQDTLNRQRMRRDAEAAAREARAAALEEAAERREEALEAAREQRVREAEDRQEQQERQHNRAERRTAIVAGTDVRVGDYQEMLDRMDADGLIDQDDHFAVAYSNGKLNINGKEQPQSVTRKYQSFLNGKRLAIAGSRNNLAIQVD